ncbi:MAG: glycerophosphodiester phosphodiesterase [Mangrovibacterium sp.]|nr:glycerophosphodiester phosphodiesterase [Mangrovibacterium sp.]
MKKMIVVWSMLFSVPAFSQVEMIAHRGASFDAPENTVASAKLAWQQNADAVEIDVYPSADNRVVVIHDKTTKRVSGVDYPVRETKSSKLRKLDVGSWKDKKYAGEKIPFLEEVLRTVPEGKILVVEIKSGSEILPALKKAVDKSGKTGQVQFISFGWETILNAKKAFPGNPCYWLSSSKEGLNAKMEESAGQGLDGVDLHHSVIDREVMDLAEKLGLEVLAWTVDDPAEAKRLEALKVKRITTNRPQWLREQVQK